MDPSSPVHLDPVTAAGEVSLRFERWFAERELELPAETRAQFIEMGMQALQRWPERSTGDVLDELIGELDTRLEAIVAEQSSTGDAARADTNNAPRGLSRWFQRGRDRRH